MPNVRGAFDRGIGCSEARRRAEPGVYYGRVSYLSYGSYLSVQDQYRKNEHLSVLSWNMFSRYQMAGIQNSVFDIRYFLIQILKDQREHYRGSCTESTDSTGA